MAELIDCDAGSIRSLAGEWDVTIHPLDSHPIERELGVSSQRSLEGRLRR